MIRIGINLYASYSALALIASMSAVFFACFVLGSVTSRYALVCTPTMVNMRIVPRVQCSVNPLYRYILKYYIFTHCRTIMLSGARSLTEDAGVRLKLIGGRAIPEDPAVVVLASPLLNLTLKLVQLVNPQTIKSTTATVDDGNGGGRVVDVTYDHVWYRGTVVGDVEGSARLSGRRSLTTVSTTS